MCLNEKPPYKLSNVQCSCGAFPLRLRWAGKISFEHFRALRTSLQVTLTILMLPAPRQTLSEGRRARTLGTRPGQVSER